MVRELPKGWKWVALGDLCQKQAETRDPSVAPDTLFTYVDIASVNNATKTIEEPQELLGRDAPSRARRVIRSNDVLVATTRPYLNAVALVPAPLDGQICSTGFCVLRCRPGAPLEQRYLFSFVQSQEFIDRVCVNMRGANYPAVSDSDVFAVEMPLPPLPEQCRLVALVKAALAQVEAAEREMAALRERLQALRASVLEAAFRGAI